MAQKKKKPKYFIYIPIAGVLAVLFAAAFVVDTYFSNTMRAALSKTIVDEELQKEAQSEAEEISVELVEEGSVLLKNDGILPLSETKINLFGVKSVDLSYNAAGSAAGTTTDAITLKEGLEKAGFEINSDLYKLIESNATISDTDVDEGGSSKSVNELALDKYTGNTAFDKLKEYSDIAVVTIGRLGGEGGDISRTGFGEHGDQHYLCLNPKEEALLKKLSEEGFRVITLINSSYPMELGFVEDTDYGVDACLWIGGPGAAGTPGIGNILNGSVNPSGRLADTYAYDLTTSSTYYTADTYNYVTESSGSYTDCGGFTEFSEGIYVGYRWYETADAVGYWDVSPYTGYDNVVQYPFGYGLSYSTFTQEFVSTPTISGNEISFQVKVTNTGSVKGKEVVQIYAETPYTEGGLEKAKVVLAAFDKTQLLDPSSSETIDLVINLEEIASFDSSASEGKGAYVLEAGDYNFYLSENSHSWKGIDSSKVFTHNLSTEVVFSGENKRASDKTAAENVLYKDNFGAKMDLDNGIEVLSRKSGFANASVLQPTYTIVDMRGSSKKVRIIAEDSEIYKNLVTDAKKNPTK